MADPYDSTAETEKMGASDSDKSSVESIPGPATMAELDLEKTTTKHTNRTTRSARSIPQTAQDWDGEDDPGRTFRCFRSLASCRNLTKTLQTILEIGR